MTENFYAKLKEYNEKGYSSLHTPGHKYGDFLPADLLKLDLTELPDTDALFEADGIIKELEKAFSDIYGTAASFISAGGCSLAIQAMIRTALDCGGKMLCARNAHRSAVNAMALLGIDPVWIYPQGSGHYTGRISPDDVSRAFADDPDIKSLYITSPTYYGEISDIPAIADICHKHDAVLLVDNAHGSHLAFIEDNIHPIKLGADMTACSLHKTMPVMTGGALLNVRTNKLAENAKSYMSLFASTSPSYVIMSSMSLCADYIKHGSGTYDYRQCEIEVNKLRAFALQNNIPVPEGLCDPLRLTLNTSAAGISGEDKQQEFFHQNKIECEFCDGENAVMLFTPFNRKEDFERVKTATGKLKNNSANTQIEYHSLRPEKAVSLREAMLSPSEMIFIDKSIGRIAADTACPCPPGVPVIMPGEIIDEEIIYELNRFGIDRIKVKK